MALTLTPEDLAAIADAVWDEILTGATHNIPTSAGRRLRTLAAQIIYESTLPSQASALSNTVILDSGASSTNGAYDPAIICIVEGTGTGQTRMIYEYVGSTRTAILDRDWKTQPDNTSLFMILADPGREHVNEGLVRGGSNNTVRLNANASTDDDSYLGQIVFIRSGYGADQARKIISYDGATQTATVNPNWDIVPNTTSAYVMLPTGGFSQADLVEQVWGATTRTLTSGGGGASAADVWTYGTRTLTQAAVAPQEFIDAGTLSGLRGDTLSLSITDLGSLANYSALYFTVKTDFALTDAESTIQIVKKPGGSDGLLYLNGASTTTSWGSITINDSITGDITIALNANATKELEVNLYNYDVQIVRSSGVPVSTLAFGRLSIIDDVTRSIA